MPSRPRLSPILLKRAREMRHESVLAEKKLWSCLRNRQLAGMKFRRQHCVGSFIVDFVCIERKLIVELDGDSHADRLDYDADRTRQLNRDGYRVIRLFNHDLQRHLVEVLE